MTNEFFDGLNSFTALVFVKLSDIFGFAAVQNGDFRPD
jgi:hypothetical protein